ncbi:unnamed protein product [Orchesella dallaii]|uniref:Cuticle protein n=1 Tax=Orchesella dallaii TaxID=48710 RepID=A0ABP1PQF4_9HEXA
MKTQVALLLFGFVAFASANRKLQQVPIKSYGAPAATSVLIEEKDASYDELPAAPAAPVVHKNPTRVVEKAPIRVSTHTKNDDYAPAPSRKTQLEHEEYAEEQNKNAQYSFASAVDDGIMDHSHVRQESREGKKVTGSYGYSDGYFKRTVNYEADENGYRVVAETVEPISDHGPQVDLVNGKADIHTQIGGVDTQYSVNADELAQLKIGRKVMLD